MPFISGHDINENKKIIYGLKEIYGLNLTTNIEICKNLGISLNLKGKNLTKQQQDQITKYIKENYITDKMLKNNILENIKKYQNNQSWRGIRYKLKLPVRGQRTHSNAKTQRKIPLV